MSDGNIEYLGRKDDQVKINGYRIELGEIEQKLLLKDEISQAIILVTEEQDGEKELTSFIVADGAQNLTELKEYLKQSMPQYMIPTHFIQLDKLPLTINGKIDKVRLLNLKAQEISSGAEYVAPSNEIEEKLVKIWSKSLRREKVGVKDDFFNIGGNSIKESELSLKYKKNLKSILISQPYSKILALRH